MRRSTRGIAMAAVLALGLVAAADVPPLTEDQQRRLAIPCDEPFAPTGETVPQGVVATDVTITTVDGTELTGCLARPTGDPKAIDDLVVFAHGNGHAVQDAWRRHTWEVASHGAAAIAVNYRDNFGFPTHQGAEDVIVTTRWAQERFRGLDRTILFGVSMGGAISGTALTKSADVAPGMFDLWFDVEGVSMLLESWAEASAAVPDIAAAIERDAGGTPAEVPDRYVEGSPALNADRMVAAGLQGAVVVHAPWDGLVPYWQGREMAAALVAAGVPTEFHTTVRGDGGPAGGDTTPFGLVPVVGGDLDDLNDQTVGLAGHASERDPDHPVMRTSLDRLLAILAGSGVTPTESVADAG